MDSPHLSVDNNKNINILILIILGIVILIIGLLLIYSYGMKLKSCFLNNIITGLILIFVVLTFITSGLYISYRYQYGDNVIDNIDIIIKPIMYIALSGIVAMILLSSKNYISSSKPDFDINMIIMKISSGQSKLGTIYDEPEFFKPRNMQRMSSTSPLEYKSEMGTISSTSSTNSNLPK